MNQCPEITLVHTLENRVRLKFNMPPKQPALLEKALRNNEEVQYASYSSISQTIVIRFNHHQTNLLHLLKQIVLHLASEYTYHPVLIRHADQSNRLTPLAITAAATITAATVSYIFNPMTRTTMLLRGLCTGLTATAVLEHAYNEFYENGMIDFENLSIVYLGNSVLEGSLLKGASITWLATFTRHLLPVDPNNGLRMHVLEGTDPQTGKRYNDVIVSGHLTKKRGKATECPLNPSQTKIVQQN